MILAVCGMCDYKHQIAVSQTMINLKGELQEVCIASRRVWWNAKLCRTWVTGTFLKGHRKLVREWFCGCSSRITEFQGLFFSLSAPHLTPSPPPICKTWAKQTVSGVCYLLASFESEIRRQGGPTREPPFFFKVAADVSREEMKMGKYCPA